MEHMPAVARLPPLVALIAHLAAASKQPAATCQRHNVLMQNNVLMQTSQRLQSSSGTLRAKDLGTRRGAALASTTVVLKTYGNWTDWKTWLAERYGRQLASLQVQFSVLRDVTKLEEGRESVESTSHQFGNSTAQLCDVTWRAAEKSLGPKLFDDSGRDDGKADPHILTSIYELLWWRQCAPKLPRRDVQFVWFVEHDAFFNGDLGRFVQAYADDDADLAARGFRVAGPEWWLYGHFLQGFERGLKTFGVEDALVSNVSPLPEISEGECSQNVTNNTHGLLVAQDHVVRYSSRFFRMLSAAADRGVVGPGEGFKPTLCASGFGLKDGEACSMLDFDPVRSSQLRWISPIYCWLQLRSEPEREAPWDDRDLPCDPRWLDKWVHPVKLDKGPALRKREC